MYLLIDTAFDACQAGLWQDGALRAFVSLPGEAKHDVVLAPLVQQLLLEQDVTVAQLKGIAVITGPGRFTSLRVGIAMARALVLPHHVPLIGVSTGQILHAMLPTENAAWLVMVKRGEVFAQTPAMVEPEVIAMDRVAAWLVDQDVQHLAVIGAGVPTAWETIVPATIQAQILTSLPLPVMGQIVEPLLRHAPAGAGQPVRPFYGQSSGAWDKVAG
jgi:tRNA threonylcarbamoyl adenosine modification protein YeaZ